MDDDIKTATEDQFYYELINRFFHPRSYFFNCLTNYLNRPLSIANNPETSTIKVLGEFIEFLTTSKKAAQDLLEITQIKDFEYIYSNLKNQIIRYDLRSLEQPQLKKAIQHIALSLLKDIYLILKNNEKNCKTLTLYIEIKSKLRDLLNGSNGKHPNKNLIPSIEKLSAEPSCETDNQLSARSSSYPAENISSELNIDNINTNRIHSFENSAEKEKGSSFEINTSYNEFKQASSRSIHKPNSGSIFFDLHSESNTIKKKNNNHILIPGDDDEEVLKLIQEIDSCKECLPLKNFMEPEDIKNTNSPVSSPMDNINQERDEQCPEDVDVEEFIDDNDKDKDKNSDDDDDDEIIFDESTNKIFQQEAVLYYKILSGAISQLKNDDKIPSALEDIELASSSLKHLAQKFGMEKLALLPELIESISMLSDNHSFSFPSSILQGIEDAINLLKKFDVNNMEHRTEFMSLLTLLKEYYVKSLHSDRKNPVTFQ